MMLLETRHGPDVASTSLQIVCCKLVDRLIVRLWRCGQVELAASTGQFDLARSTWLARPGLLDLARSTWPHRPGPIEQARSTWPARPGSIDLAVSPQPND